MKKKITLLLLSAICIACSLSAQNVFKLADYEDGKDCFLGNNSGNPGTNNGITKEIVDNPTKDAINGSSKVLKVAYPLLTGATYGVVFANGFCSNVPGSPIPIGEESDQYRYLHFKILKIKTSRVEWNFREQGGSGSAWSSIMISGTPTPPEDLEDPYYSKTEGELWQEATWQSIVVDFMTTHINCNIPTEITKRDYYGYMLNLDKDNKIGSAFTTYIDDIYFSSSEETPFIVGINDIAKKSEISVVKGSTVLVNDVKGSLKLEIYNLQGQLIEEVYNGIANTGAYELPALPQSVYILKATTENGVQNIKFLK